MQDWNKTNPNQYAHGATQYNPQQYPPGDYYSQYYPGQYNSNYQRPYDNNYSFHGNTQQYPYRPMMYQPPPPAPPTQPPLPYQPPRQPPPPPPNSSNKDCSEVRSEYRRESFSSYRDTANKKPKRTHTRVDQPKGVVSASNTRVNPLKRREYFSDDDLSDYDENLSEYESEAESVQSVITLMRDSTIHSESRNVEPMEASDETDIPITDKERQDYFKRLELIYATLDDKLTPPQPKEKVTASLARGTVKVTSKPTSLPASDFILQKFEAYHDRATQAIETVKIKPTSRDKCEPTQVKVTSSTKPKLGFDKNPFNPRWLYNITEEEWPQKVKPDEAINLLTPNFEPPSENFSIKKKEIHQIQHATSLTLNASSHIDWNLAAVRKLLTEAINLGTSATNHLRAIQDLIGGAAYANEFMCDQQIYIHGGLTNKMREEYIQEMEDITPSEQVELLAQPYHASAAFNGQIQHIIKDVRERESAMAFKKVSRSHNRNSGPPRRKRQKTSHPGLTNFLSRNYGTHTSTRFNASKGGPRSHYGQFDSKGRKQTTQHRQSLNKTWQQHRGSNTKFQPKRKFSKSQQKSRSQQGNRNRDHN
mgnify:CR=1 FL=1